METETIWFYTYLQPQPDTMLFSDNLVLLATSEHNLQQFIYNFNTNATKYQCK